MSSHSSTSIIKFADDTVVLGLISNNYETAYLDEVERLTLWCQDNCLSLNVSKTNAAFPLHGTVRFGTARYGTVRLSSGWFAFPLQFSTAIEWAGLFTRRYNCAASTAVTSS